MWGRFAIRTSHAEFGPQRSVVVSRRPWLPDVIVCPAQTKASEACATCGLCWAEAARPKTIAFLKHGDDQVFGEASAPVEAAEESEPPEPEPAGAAAVQLPPITSVAAMAAEALAPPKAPPAAVLASPFRLKPRKRPAFVAPERTTRLKALSDNVIRWCSFYLASGVDLDFLAFCFDVDETQLAQAVRA
jgi:hypothetical protein